MTAVAHRTKRDRKWDVSSWSGVDAEKYDIICARVNITSAWRTTITGENSYGKEKGEGEWNGMANERGEMVHTWKLRKY